MEQSINRTMERQWILRPLWSRILLRSRWEIYYAFKRFLDIVIALTALLLLSPLMIGVAMAIRLDSPGPVLFRQSRVLSRRGEKKFEEKWETSTFTCLKFRSMYKDTNSELHKAFIEAFIKNDKEGMAECQGDTKSDACKLVNDPRVSRVGRFIRKTSIDELPQFFNVLRGEMSIVGPRPAIPYEVEMYDQWHRKRLQTKPGLTGWWQVKGRGIAEFDEGMRQDIWYIEHQNLLLDMWIILMTPWVILKGRGAH